MRTTATMANGDIYIRNTVILLFLVKQASCLTRTPAAWEACTIGQAGSLSYGSACEKLPIVAIPITLKSFSWGVLSVQVQKLFELRITCGDLLWFGKFVIRQVIPPAASYRQID